MWPFSAFKMLIKKVLSLFEGYFDTDKADAQNRYIVQDRINTDMDFNSKVFESNYVSQPTPSPLEHTQGDHISYGLVIQVSIVSKSDQPCRAKKKKNFT